MGMARPIFVGGAVRTGTTWLANIISRHSKVACIQGVIGVRKDGVYESAFFSHVVGMFGSLENDNNLIQLIEVFASSSYFITSGLDKDIFYREKPRTYQKFFRLLMDSFAEKKGAAIWLEKTPAHSFYFEEIVRYYNDAKIIVIKRNPVDQIRSVVKLNQKKNKKYNRFVHKAVSIIKRLFEYHACYKHIQRLMAKKPDKVKLIHYEELQKPELREGIISMLCDFLEIEFEENMLGKWDDRKTNTSFTTDDERDKVLSPIDVTGIRIISCALELLPYRLYRLVYLSKRAINVKRKKLPDWFFKIRK